MATINVQDVAKEINTYVKNNTEVIRAGVYSDEIAINKYCKTLTAIKGKFPQFHSLLTRVVQGFKAEWQELGEAQFKHKMLQNFHQKVNFPVIPSEILNTWLADLYTENKKPEDMPISKYIIDGLMAKVVDDLDDLSQTGVFDANNFDGEYGHSLNGITKIVQVALANTTHPAFKIPLNVITSSNRIDEIKSFEKQLPKKTAKKVKRVFMSEDARLDYIDQYEQEYGRNTAFKEGDKLLTPLLKLEIVGLRGIPNDMMFCTVEGNLARLIDVFDKPQVTDVQVLDYKVKIFMEFFLGYDFLINQLLYVAVYDDSDRGLGNAGQNALYYDSENLVVTP